MGDARPSWDIIRSIIYKAIASDDGFGLRADRATAAVFEAWDTRAREAPAAPQVDEENAALIERLRGLLAKATKGPWQVGDESDIWDGDGMYAHGIPLFRADRGAARSWGRKIEWPELAADAALIVEAINALPGLLDRLSTLTPSQADAGVRGFYDAVREFGPNGELVAVCIHPNGDWSVYDPASENAPVVVPRVPTPAMIEAGDDLIPIARGTESWAMSGMATPEAIYAAMIAAATPPSPEPEKQPRPPVEGDMREAIHEAMRANLSFMAEGDTVHFLGFEKAVDAVLTKIEKQP